MNRPHTSTPGDAPKRLRHGIAGALPVVLSCELLSSLGELRLGLGDSCFEPLAFPLEFLADLGLLEHHLDTLPDSASSW